MKYQIKTSSGEGGTDTYYENIVYAKNKDDVIWELMQELSQYAEKQITVRFPDGSYIQTESWD